MSWFTDFSHTLYHDWFAKHWLDINYDNNAQYIWLVFMFSKTSLDFRKKIYRYFCLLFFQVYVEDKDGKVTRMEILEVKQKMGLLRKAVPTLPICIAILLFLINCVLPGIGKLKLLTVILGSKKLSQHKLQGFIWVIIWLRLLCNMNMKNNKKDHVFRSVTWSFCFSEANNKLFGMDNSNDFMDVLNVFVQLFVLIPPNSLPYAFLKQKSSYCKSIAKCNNFPYFFTTQEHF